jgi:hypothetical protein
MPAGFVPASALRAPRPIVDVAPAKAVICRKNARRFKLGDEFIAVFDNSCGPGIQPKPNPPI